MPHTLPTHARQSHFNAAPVADYATMFDAFVLAAITFPVAHWPENTLTEQAAFFRFERPVINRLRIFHLAV